MLKIETPTTVNSLTPGLDLLYARLDATNQPFTGPTLTVSASNDFGTSPVDAVRIIAENTSPTNAYVEFQMKTDISDMRFGSGGTGTTPFGFVEGSGYMGTVSYTPLVLAAGGAPKMYFDPMNGVYIADRFGGFAPDDGTSSLQTLGDVVFYGEWGVEPVMKITDAGDPNIGTPIPRVLINSPTDDGTSALQVAGTVSVISSGTSSFGPGYPLTVVDEYNAYQVMEVTTSASGDYACGFLFVTGGTLTGAFSVTSPNYSSTSPLFIPDSLYFQNTSANVGNLAFVNYNGPIKFVTGASLVERMRVLNSGGVLIGDRAGAMPTDDTTSALQVNGNTRITGTLGASGYSEAAVVKTDTYTATSTDDLIVCNKATAMTINLPAATGSGKLYTIKNVGVGVVTVDGNTTDTIDGDLTQTLRQWESFEVMDYAAGAWVAD